jgi:hypothetical protein
LVTYEGVLECGRTKKEKKNNAMNEKKNMASKAIIDMVPKKTK